MCINALQIEVRTGIASAGSDIHIVEIGGTVGDYEAILDNKSKTKKIYEKYGWGETNDGQFVVTGRHRHRYEIKTRPLNTHPLFMELIKSLK